MNLSTLKVGLLIAASVAITLACGQASPVEIEPASPPLFTQSNGAEAGPSMPATAVQASQPGPSPSTPTSVASVGQSARITPTVPTPTPTDTSPVKLAINTEMPDPTSTPEAVGQPSQNNLAVPTPTPVVHHHGSLYRNAAAPLDSRINHADVIALVNLRQATGITETVPSDAGVAPTYRPAVEFRFEVIEYLKGAGEDEIVVWDPAPHTFLTSEESQENAEHKLAVRRNSTWDDRAAVVFLYVMQKGDSGDSTIDPYQVHYGFRTMNDTDWGEHTIDEVGKAWLPAKERTPGAQDVATFVRSAGDGLELLTDADPNGGSDDVPLIITLGDLRSRIDGVTTLVAEGKGVEGYEECLTQRYYTEHWILSWEARNGPYDERPAIPKQVSSGQPADTEFHNSYIAGGEFSKWWLTGADAVLFTVKIVDESGQVIVPDDRDLVEFHVSSRVARPLPAGTYEFEEHEQLLSWIPCDHSVPVRKWQINVVAPDDSVHEAFFDPVEVDDSVGVSGTVGVLAPRALSVEGEETALASLMWQTGSVAMELNDHISLGEYTLDFISLDGSMPLSLSFNDATTDNEAAIFTWAVDEQPWRDGDLLMLRIRESQ